MTEAKEKPTGAKVPFGAYLVEQGHITPGELQAYLILQEERNSKLGELARQHQMLTFEKICAILEYQRRHNVRFGRAALELGLLSDQELAELIEEQTSHHIWLGQLLVELNVLTPQELGHCLEAYTKATGVELPTNDLASSPSEGSFSSS